MKRRGGVLMEAVTAMMLLSVLAVSAAQMVSMMNRQSRLLSQRSVALQECHNALANVASQDAKRLDASFLKTLTLPESATNILPEGALEIVQIPPEIESNADEEGVQLKAIVRWRPAAHAEPAEVSLSLWRFDLVDAASSTGAAGDGGSK